MLDFDFLKQVEYPQVILAHKSYEKIGELNGVTGLKIDLNLNRPDEISFQLPYRINGTSSPFWDRVVDLATVFIPRFGYFILSVSEQDDGENKTKSVSGKSMETELGQILLNGIQINVVDGDITDEDYKQKKFYQPLDPRHSVLHILLKEVPHWEIGHVDEILWEKQRSLDIDGTSVYDELTGEIAEQFDCMFQFDVFNRSIHVYDKKSFGDDTTLYLSHDNFIESFTVEADADSIKNCFKVSGADGLDIREVNPNGSVYIYAWGEHDLRDMSDELTGRLEAYQDLYQSKMEAYQDLMLQINRRIDRLNELKSKAPEKEDTTDRTRFSMDYLQEKLAVKQNELDSYKNAGYGLTTDPNYQTIYYPAYLALTAIQEEIRVRANQINAVYQEYRTLKNQVEAIQKTLDLETYLGSGLWKELSSYRREQEYTNDTFFLTDDTTDVERFQMENELYKQAWEEVCRAKEPVYSFSASLANLFAIFELQESVAGQFKLGNFIRVSNAEEEISRVRLFHIGIDFENLSDIKVEFSDMAKTLDRASDWFQKIQSAATSYDFIRKQLDKDKDAVNYVRAIRLNGLSSALADVQNADNQEFTIGSRGIIGLEWNEEKRDYEPEQIHIIKNKIVFTDDSWKSCRLAIGKVNIAGENVYGVIGDVIVGKIILGESLLVTNASGGMIFDDNGLRLTNGSKTISLNPNSSRMFSISDPTAEYLSFDETGLHIHGNGIFTGTVRAGKVVTCEITGGTITGSTITCDSGVIGNVNIANNGLFGGYINANVIYSSSYSQTDGGYSTNYTQITGGNVVINGQDNYFLNSGTFYDAEEGGLYDARVMVKNGTILMKGMNTYLRGMVNGRGYYNIAGLSKAGNVVVGYNGSASHGYFNSETASSAGTLGWIPTYVYGQNITLNAQNGGGTISLNGSVNIGGSAAVTAGNLASYASRIPSGSLTASIGSGTYGTYVSVGGTGVPTGAWVQSYCASHYQPLGISDLRLKKDLRLAEPSELELLRRLKLYSYRYKDSTEEDRPHYGLLAQEILSAMKDLGMEAGSQSVVTEYEVREDKEEGMYTGKKAYRVNYQELFSLLLLGWQDLDQRMYALENGGT